MILWRITTFIGIYQPQISPILLYVRCKSGVHFILRCFRDAKSLIRNFLVQTRWRSGLCVCSDIEASGLIQW